MAQLQVGIAMSGGVDSSVTAYLLKQKGHDVHGFFMLLPLPGFEEHVNRVQSIADHLQIPLHLLDIKEFFSKTVINYFIDTYQNGWTPNPCVICNQQVKFGSLLNAMRSKGMDKMATGHYARIKKHNSSYLLQRGRDPKKDQSYFLCRLSSQQLENIILPLGDLTKDEVYQIAAQLNLSGKHGPESQDICFLANETVSTFFAKQGHKDAPGDIINTEGKKLGEHRGLWHYTVGQRRGLGLPDATPWYVKQLDAPSNSLIVCKNEELFARNLLLQDVRWHDSAIQVPWEGGVQIRGRHRASRATISQADGNHLLVTFETDQRAVTPGQFAVFYSNDTVVGSGVITNQNTVGDLDQ